MKDNGNTINIIAGKEYQLRIAEVNDNLINDFFYQTYSQAFEETKKIIQENSYNKKMLESSNNIISFCGERGQGKSSAMLSFSKILEEIDVASKYFNTENSDVNEYKFHVLRRIDPTELEINHSILDVIISRIFFDFKKEIKNDTNNSINAKKRNEIINDFQKCYRNIKTIKDEHKANEHSYRIYDDIETLSIISDSANIKNDFHSLIQHFLELKFKKQKSFLVIQVDDTDLNVRSAYEIVEDIRKYFMMPNVLVLMATNVDLLTKAIDQEFQKTFSILTKSQEMSLQKTFEMANQYIIKLMPGNRRINLPEIKSVDYDNINKGIDITYKVFNKNGQLEDIYNFTYKETNKKITDLQDFVLRLIYEKTGLVFVKRIDTIHKIIPTNTRELANFLSFLRSMPNILPDGLTSSGNVNDIFKEYYKADCEVNQLELIDIRINNLKRFEKFFIETYVKLVNKNNLFDEYLNLLNISYESKILYTLNLYKHYMYSINNKEVPLERRIDNIMLKNMDSLTLSNLLDMERSLGSIYYGEEKNLLFITDTLYSIMLNIWVCNHIKEYIILHKNSEEHSIVDFLGKIYGLNFNTGLKKEEYDWGHKIKISENDFKSVLGNSVSKQLISAFGAEINNTKTINKNSFYLYNFDPELFVLRALEPIRFLKNFSRIYDVDNNSLNDKIFTDDFILFQNLAFTITTNVDLINNIIKKCNKKYNGTDYAEFLCDIFRKIVGFLDQLNYLPINNISISWIDELLKNEKDFINYIMNEPYYIEDARYRLIDNIALLTPLKGKRSMTDIKMAVSRYLSILENLVHIYPMIDILDEIKRFNKILENANKSIQKGKSWSVKTCDNYRQEINRLLLMAKDKCEYYINDNMTNE